jgi:hypothetical protein
MAGDQGDAQPAEPPLLQVVKGAPTPAEFAAVVAVISAKLRSTDTGATRSSAATPAWASYWRRRAGQPANQTVRPGPGAWRASALPN